MCGLLNIHFVVMPKNFDEREKKVLFLGFAIRGPNFI